MAAPLPGVLLFKLRETAEVDADLSPHKLQSILSESASLQTAFEELTSGFPLPIRRRDGYPWQPPLPTCGRTTSTRRSWIRSGCS